MPSPFPGMNPYLEQETVWHDFHERFLPVASDLLVPQVRPSYVVRLDINVFIHEIAAEGRWSVRRGDVNVIRTPVTSSPGGASALLEAPAYCILPPAVDIERQAFLEIRDRISREVITVIELLSPTNKRPGPDRDQYLAKRRQILASATHLVEIDLLRGGPRMPAKDLPACDYCAVVSRVEARPQAGVWPVSLRERLPAIPIPLRAPHPDAHLDLQEVLHRVYDAAGYEDDIYTGEPDPPLSQDDLTWAQLIAAQAGPT